MDFKPSEKQETFRRRAREFAEKEMAPTAAERDEKEEFSREIFDRLGKEGLVGIPYPEAYGGSGGDLTSFAMAVEEFSRVDASWGLVLPVDVALAGGSLFLHGNEEQKQKYLVPLAAGQHLASFSLTEAGAGSDPASMESTAVLDGDHYLLSGKKVFATNADEAETYVIFAMTDKAQGARGISAFILEKGYPGLSFGGRPSKLGIRATLQREIILENCRVPRENLLAQEGAGFRIALAALDLGRIGIAAQGVGIAQGAYEEALRYTKTRTQFGRPIAENQGVSFMLADMATEIEAARLLNYWAASSYDQGQRVSKEAAMAKRFATDTAMRVACDAVQLLGGLGTTKASPVERYLRDAKVTQIYEGTNQIMRVVIGASILR